MTKKTAVFFVISILFSIVFTITLSGNTQYRNSFNGNKLDFMKTHPIKPGGEAIQDGSNWSLVARTGNDLTTYADINPISERQNVQGSLLLDPDETTGIHMYFLPWGSKRIVKMQIPANTGPNVFFTAAISGCSVFVYGNPNNPILYHAGIGVDLNKGNYKDKSNTIRYNAAKIGNAPVFWRLLLEKLDGVNKSKPNYAEVNKKNYVFDGIKSFRDKGKTTARANRYHQRLQELHQNDLDIRIVIPWGCFFGLREANGNWKFYLQENATIIYTHKATSKKYVTTKVIALTQRFPSGQEATNLAPAWGRIANPTQLSDKIKQSNY